MLKIVPPNINDIEVLEDIIASMKQNKKYIENEKEYILERYRYFDDNIDNIDTIKSGKTMNDKVKSALKQSFNNSKKMKITKKKLRESFPPAIRAKCPYCMISSPNTFEHYFDKNHYPEFTVFTKNLIPCCSECNTIKGDILRDDNGERRTINFYYDDIPDKQFLFFDMKIDKNVPSFELRLELDDTIYEEKLLKNHFKYLQLKDRFKDQINDKVSSIVNEAKEQYTIGFEIEQIIIILKTRISSLRKDNGNNYWEACLYESLINQKVTFEELIRNSNV